MQAGIQLFHKKFKNLCETHNMYVDESKRFPDRNPHHRSQDPGSTILDRSYVLCVRGGDIIAIIEQSFYSQPSRKQRTRIS